MADEEEDPTFESLGLRPDSCAALRRTGWTLPAPFTLKALPHMLSGKDIVGKVLDIGGIDKTATYLVTMLEKLRHRVPHNGAVRALILTPTRDMACQTFRYAEKLSAFTDIVISLLVGGDNMESQLERLAQKPPPDAIIATPDTLIQHLSVVDLHTVEFLVIDGALEMCKLGFAGHLNQILGKLGQNRQTLLFTTTRTAAVVDLMRASMRNPKLVAPSETWKKIEALNLPLLALRLEQPCGGHHNNSLQGRPSPTQCSGLNARNRKRAVHDDMEAEGGNSKRRAENSMDEE